MIDLYYWPTPNGWKISIMLEECGLPYKVIPVNIGTGEQFKPDFLKISPNNRMPAIVDHQPPGGGEPVSVFESGAIFQYLAEKTGKFLPKDLRGRYEGLQEFRPEARGLPQPPALVREVGRRAPRGGQGQGGRRRAAQDARHQYRGAAQDPVRPDCPGGALGQVLAGGLPGRLALAFVVLERLGQRTEHLGRGLEQRLELRFVDLANVLAQLLLKAGKGMPHLLGEMRGV